MLSVHYAAEDEQQPQGADKEILSLQLQNAGTGPPPVIVAMDRTTNVLKIATVQRAGSPVSLLAQSSKEQGMIAVAIKTLYPSAAIVPSDYKVHVKGLPTLPAWTRRILVTMCPAGCAVLGSFVSLGT